MKPICIYHAGCADGFTAAWAVWKRFGDEFEYFPGVYQNPPPDVKNRDVVIVDFSFKRAVMQEMAKTARTMLVLDHHASAAADLYEDKGSQSGPPILRMDNWTAPLTWERHVGNGYQDECEGIPVAVIYAYFDMNRSGAGIAWDFFHPGAKRPELVNYVEDRDLWRFKLPLSREVNAYVFANNYDFKVWSDLAVMLEDHMLLQDVAGMGGAIEQKHHKDVAELVSELRREVVIGGHWVPVANLPKTLTSDAGHLMCQPYASPNLQGEIVTPAFAACYWDTPEGRVFSLRSVGDFDVSEIAKKYGGGGHKNASGFRLPHGVEP